jgi:hypothetical protein
VGVFAKDERAAERIGIDASKAGVGAGVHWSEDICCVIIETARLVSGRKREDRVGQKPTITATH